MKKILVTGSQGFIGRNLIEALNRRPGTELLCFDVKDSDVTLSSHLEIADAVFHLAGINRSLREAEFQEINEGLTRRIVNHLLRRKTKPLLVLSSSIKAELDSIYGRSKRKAEQAFEHYGTSGGNAAIFRLPNVFGKWSRPNYNSAVATFCYNIGRGLDISVSDPNSLVELVYIDDVVNSFIALLDEPGQQGVRWLSAGPVRSITLADLTDELYRIRDIRTGLVIPDMSDRFRRSLYATYLSFLPTDTFAYQLTKREDVRGSLAEILKSDHFGQIFISRTRAGYARGNHYHNTKFEKFFVLEGEAVIRFRHVSAKDVISYSVTGEEFKIVDIPPGYTHSIENVGQGDLVVLFWSSEPFDVNSVDTYPLTVRSQSSRNDIQE